MRNRQGYFLLTVSCMHEWTLSQTANILDQNSSMKVLIDGIKRERTSRVCDVHIDHSIVLRCNFLFSAQM